MQKKSRVIDAARFFIYFEPGLKNALIIRKS